MANLTTPIPQDKIGESFVWRDWFQKLSNKVFGTLGEQNANNVSITGGTIDGTAIGSVTPSSGNFTTIRLNTPLQIQYGGTNGYATPSLGAVSYGTGASYAFTAVGLLGQVLTSTGLGAPVWKTGNSIPPTTYTATSTATQASPYYQLSNWEVSIPSFYTNNCKFYFWYNTNDTLVPSSNIVPFANNLKTALGASKVSIISNTVGTPLSGTGGYPTIYQADHWVTTTQISNALLSTLNGIFPIYTPAPPSVSPTATTISNVAYGSDSLQVVDVVYPSTWDVNTRTGTTPKGVVLWVHGGSWSGGDKSSEVTTITPIVQANYIVINANYRLTPSGAYYNDITDIQTVINYLLNPNAGYLNAPSNNALWQSLQFQVSQFGLMVSGSSAGGYLALQGTISQVQVGGTWPTAVMSFMGPMNLVSSGSTDTGNPLGTTAMSVLATYVGNYVVQPTDTWIISNTGSASTVNLPSPSSFPGRVLYFQNYQAYTLVSSANNVVPIAGGSATNNILASGAGNWSTLVSDGINWVTTQQASSGTPTPTPTPTDSYLLLENGSYLLQENGGKIIL